MTSLSLPRRTRLAAAVLAVGALTACTDEDAPGGEVAAQASLRDHLEATAAGDWERVHELTARDARPADRTRWIEQRRDRDEPFVHRCVGDVTRPEIEVRTLVEDTGAFVIEAVVWASDTQGVICHWQVIAEDDTWRVAAVVDRITDDERS